MSQLITTFKRKFTVQSLLAFMLIVFGMLLVAAGTFIGIDLNFQIKSFIDALRDNKPNDTPAK